MPGVSAIIWWKSSVMPSGQPKYQAIRVASYGRFATTATATAHRPQRAADSAVCHRLTGRSLRPHLVQDCRDLRW